MCGTAALHRQTTSTAVQQCVFENTVFKIAYNTTNSSNSQLTLDITHPVVLSFLDTEVIRDNTVVIQMDP